MGATAVLTPDSSARHAARPAPKPQPPLHRRRLSARAQLVVAFVGPVVAAIGATFSWFRPGKFIAAGDLSPFVREGLAGELGWLWNHRSSGAGSTSAEIARALEVVAVRIAAALGGSDAVGQHLLYAAFASLAAFGASYFARAFTDRPGAIAVAGLIGVFNPVVLVNLPNPLVLLVTGVIGLLGGLIVQAAIGRVVTGLRFAAVTLLASYLSINPPLLVVAAVVVAGIAGGASLLTGPGGTRRAAGLLLRAAPWCLLLNLWWLVPFAIANFDGEGLEFVAPTDAAGWAWSHAENDLANVVTLNASWAWPHAEYMPFAAGLDGAPWVWLRWVLPVVAVASPFVARGRRRTAAITLTLATLALIVVGKGLHEPLTGFNGALYDRLPGFWLLREPMSKVGGVLVLLYAALAAITSTAVLDRARAQSRRAHGVALVGAAVVAAAALAYVHPLWTGTVIRGDDPEIPGARVEVPSGWHHAAHFVNGSPRPGKALVLPLDSFYQMTTTWGYHGVDDVARQLLHRPVLQQLPGGYFSDTDALESILTGVEGALVSEDTVAVPRLLQSLGVSHVLVRHDLTQGQVVRPVADDAQLGEALSSVDGVERVAGFGVVDVYEVDHDAHPVRAYPNAVGVGGAVGADDVVASLEEDEVAAPLSTDGLGAVAITVTEEPLRTEFDLAAAGSYSIELEGEEAAALYQPRLEDEPGPGATLTFADPTKGTFDGEELPVRPDVSMALPTDDVAGLSVDGQVRTLTGDDPPVVLGPATPVTVYTTSGPSVLGPFTPVGDCHALDDRTADEAGIGAEPIDRGVRLRAVAHTACVSTAPTAVTSDVYRLDLSSRTVRGQWARLCVWQFGPQRCAALPGLPGGPGWAKTETLVRLDPGTTAVQLFVYADGDGARETVTEYRDLTLMPLTESIVTVVDPRPATPRKIELDAGQHDVAVVRDLPAPELDSFSALQDCNAVDDRPPGLDVAAITGGVRLEAAAHSACVSASVNDPGSATYQFALEARTVNGRPARACVWEVGPDRCADIPALDAGSEWTPYSATFRPDPDTTALQVYLYADGQDAPRTVTEYRNLRLGPVLPTTLRIRPVDHPDAATPSLNVEEQNPGRYTVSIADARGPFVLALAESFGDGWTIRGLPDGARAEHIVVDGYANGWQVDAHGDLDLILEHRPTSRARTALRISLITVAAALAVAAVRLFDAVATVRRRRSAIAAMTRRSDRGLPAA